MADGADATRPENVLYPTCKCSNPCDIQCFPVNDFIVALAYNPEILEVDPLSSNILKSTSRTVNQNRRATRAHKKFMADLRRWLARGYLIVVREWKPDFHVTWNTESVRIFKGSTERLVDYQGKSSLSQLFLLLLFSVGRCPPKGQGLRPSKSPGLAQADHALRISRFGREFP